MLVQAGRGEGLENSSPVAATLFDRATIESAPATAIDEVLREAAAFSLFRRTSSASANPTAQGVSLRGIGPSGASRSLVLLDGIPLNDPFGGWVTWAKVPLLTLGRAEILRGGGSALWGSGALGGTIALTSRALGEGSPFEASGELGDYSSRNTQFAATAATGRSGIRLAAADYRTSGFYGLPEANRGPVDRPLDVRHRLADVSVERELGHGTKVVLTGGLFSEDRGNGTSLQRNATRDASDAIRVSGEQASGLVWSADIYSEAERFKSYFSSVNAARTVETPANNQFDVPASAFGGAVTLEQRGANAATTFGADARDVIGETREDFSYVSGRFTRRRFAGGTQVIGGAFVRHERRFAAAWRASLTLRFDRWENSAGHRREFDTASGAPTRSDAYPIATGTQFSPAAGLVYALNRSWSFRSSVYRAFRLPTLNEYYRPFRVGSVNTDANPALVPESLVGGEVGCDWTWGTLRIGATVFGNRMSDAVGNVTLSQTPAATNRQRENIDATRANGIEFNVRWHPAAGLELRGEYLLDQAYVATARLQPNLVGLRLAEVPRETFRAAATYTGLAALRLDLAVRYVGRQFDDDQNLLPLAPATVVDAEISRHFGRHFETYLMVQNLFDARVQTSHTSDGLIAFDEPRTTRVGFRYRW